MVRRRWLAAGLVAAIVAGSQVVLGGAAVRRELQPPAGAEYVSLRSIAKTPDGSAVDQTVIRSYGLRQAG